MGTKASTPQFDNTESDINEAERTVNAETDVNSDRLELYLNDVHETECRYSAEKEEIQFLQNGVETIVEKIVKDACESDWLEITEPGILKVGSYYEDTKNQFPNEFDFLFIIKRSAKKESFPTLRYGKLQYAVIFYFEQYAGQLEDFCFSKADSQTGVTRKLYMTKTWTTRGPAVKITCMYEHTGLKTPIYIDITPAVKLTNRKLIKHVVKKECCLKPFREQVLSTNSILYVGKSFSFTETEVHFMRNVLSDNHVKVYQILKYLINGHGDDEKLDDYLEGKGIRKGYSSYNIKTMMIYHHYTCRVVDTDGVGICVVAVFESLEDFPSLMTPTWRYKVTCMAELCLRNYVHTMVETLTSMQLSKGVYSYKTDQLKKSVSQQYLDEHTNPKHQ